MAGGTVILRCLTLNLWGSEPPLEARMRFVIAGLREHAPDVIALQEVRAIAGELPNQAETLARACGYHHVFAAAVSWPDGEFGNAVLARGPIREHAVTDLPHAERNERRILLSARVETAAGAVWVHSTHLDYRLHHGREREDQVIAIERALDARASETPQVLMGDFNAHPDADEIRWLTGLTTLDGRRVCFQDAWAVARRTEEGWTWASANPYTEQLRCLTLDRRIDYVFVTPMRHDGRGRVRACRIVFDRPSADGVFASDHFGVLADVQIAPG